MQRNKTLTPYKVCWARKNRPPLRLSIERQQDIKKRILLRLFMKISKKLNSGAVTQSSSELGESIQVSLLAVNLSFRFVKPELAHPDLLKTCYTPISA